MWNANENATLNFLVCQGKQSFSLKKYSSEIGEFSDKPYWDDINTRQAYRNLRDSRLEDGSMTELQQDAWTFTSFFGRLNYNFKDKYSLQLTGRIDGSSKFGSNNKYGVFPTVSGAWTISEEDFMDNISWIDFLKFRASYGIVGNANIPSGVYYDNFQVGGNNYNGSGTLYLNNLGNPDLQWETMQNKNAGIGFSALKNKLNG